MFSRVVSTLLVTMAISCIVSEIKYWSKRVEFSYPLHWTHLLGDACQKTAIKLGTEKLEWCGYLTMVSLMMRLATVIQYQCETSREASCNSLVHAVLM